MPLVDAIILTLICIGFVGFAALLAWGQYQTRDINRDKPLSRQSH